MTFLLRSCLTSLAVGTFLVVSGQAQVAVQAPLTRVEVGPNQVKVQAPFVRIQVPVVPQPTGTPPMFVVPPPPPPPAPIILPVPPAGTLPLTTAEFAASFKPLPGTYEVVLLHPFTGQPVKVVFTLPRTEGYYKTHARPRFIEFDSPDHAVEIRFHRNGRVNVEKY